MISHRIITDISRYGHGIRLECVYERDDGGLGIPLSWLEEYESQYWPNEKMLYVPLSDEPHPMRKMPFCIDVSILLLIVLIMLIIDIDLLSAFHYIRGRSASSQWLLCANRRGEGCSMRSRRGETLDFRSE